MRASIAVFTPCDFAFHANGIKSEATPNTEMVLIPRFDLNDEVDEPFSSSQIRSVSEIGIVLPLDTFDKDVNALIKQYSLNYFHKQTPSEHFRVLGNEEGLFIMVPKNRLWFATENEAKIYPSIITFINNDKLHKLNLP